jgi:hypothetical protein
MIAEQTQTTPQLDELRKRAQERHAAMNKSIVDVSQANAGLLKEAQTWDCTGEIDISAILVHTAVRIDDMRFDNGMVLEFDGTGWGVGLGVTGKSIGAGIFNFSPSDLLRFGEVQFQVFFLTAGIGGLEVSIWNDNQYLGIFAAGSIGAGLGSFGGEGKFKQI